MGTTIKRVVRGLLVAAMMLPGASCKDESKAPPREAPPNPTPPPAPAAEAEAKAAPSTPTGHQDQLLAWLDPAAVSVAYLRLPKRLRGDTVAVVYGLPTRAEDLLQAVADVDQALDAVRPSDAPPTDSWLSTESLVTIGRLASRPTVLHPLLVPKEEAITRIEALGLRKQDDDVFDVWVPQRVFPYKVALLEGDVVAFVPATDPGGMSPLASARDMPPSEVETQLGDLLGQPGAPSLALFAAGPMMHYDLDDDVLMVRFELRRASDGSLDGQLALQVDGDAAAAASALDGRKAPEQSDRIQQLVERAAYQADAGVVAGRLELTPADAKLLLLNP